MNHSKIAQPILIVLALALVGCANPAQRIATPGSENGSLSLSMPAIVTGTGTNPLDKFPASRVYGPYTSVEVEVLDSAGQSVATSEFTNTDSMAVLSIPPGTGYQVNLKVFHSGTSSTVPTVVGSATGVTVAAGQNTSVAITCVPYAPLQATGEDSVTLTTSGGQVFYKVNVEYGKTYRADAEEANEDDNYYGKVGFGLFDDLGRAIKKWRSDMSSDWTSSYTGVAYIGLYNKDLTPLNLTLYTEENEIVLGTIAEPSEIEDLDFYFVLGKTAPEYVTITVSQTGTYQFDLETDSVYTVKMYADATYTGTPTVYESSSGRVALDLVSSQTYYVTLETTKPYDHVAAGTFTRLLPTSGGAYVDGTLTEDLPFALYVVNVEPGASYTVNWADSQDQPSGEDYSADVLVTAFKDDLEAANAYFRGADSGHTVGQAFTAAAGQTRMYLYVLFDGEVLADCTFGIKVTKN